MKTSYLHKCCMLSTQCEHTGKSKAHLVLFLYGVGCKRSLVHKKWTTSFHLAIIIITIWLYLTINELKRIMKINPKINVDISILLLLTSLFSPGHMSIFLHINHPLYIGCLRMRRDKLSSNYSSDSHAIT